jgi:hypothetical protein
LTRSAAPERRAALARSCGRSRRPSHPWAPSDLLASGRRPVSGQNLTVTPAPQITSRVRRSGNHTPPSPAQASLPMTAPLLHAKSGVARRRRHAAGFRPIGHVRVTEGDSVRQVIQSFGMYWKLSCASCLSQSPGTRKVIRPGGGVKGSVTAGRPQRSS